MKLLIQLDCNIRETRYNRELSMGCLTIKIATHVKVRFRAIPHHRIMRDYPLALTLNHYSQHWWNRGVFYV